MGMSSAEFAVRIIPALAGNTRRPRLASSATTDHPRSRGEYTQRRCRMVTATGSSPLSRGIPAPLRGRTWPGGIIPALAGNTQSGPGCIRRRGDHPRSRGEYHWRWPRGPHCAGSSPLSRGILKRDQATGRLRRIIPALAGNTPVPVRPRNCHTDHPRSRGEYSGVRLIRASAIGSSPLSRGILPQGRDAPYAAGIIPALAGNTVDSAGRR